MFFNVCLFFFSQSPISQAFIIGWTSDFIPKLVFKYAESTNQTMEGYVDWSLSYFNVSDFQARSVPDDPNREEFGEVSICRYVLLMIICFSLSILDLVLSRLL